MNATVAKLLAYWLETIAHRILTGYEVTVVRDERCLSDIRTTVRVDQREGR